MVTSCDITYDDDRSEFVLLPNGLYVLPGGRLADATFCLVWCDACDGLQAAECIASPDELQARIDALAADKIPVGWDFLNAWRPEELQRLLNRWRRELTYFRSRTAPPRCIECGRAEIRPLDARVQKHSVAGREFNVAYAFADTSIDRSLTIFSAEGIVMGEIHRYDERGTRIDSGYPYPALMRILADAGIDPGDNNG